MTCEEVLAEVWRENDEEYSSFDDSESDEGEEDDNNVYGYPNEGDNKTRSPTPWSTLWST